MRRTGVLAAVSPERLKRPSLTDSGMYVISMACDGAVLNGRGLYVGKADEAWPSFTRSA